MAERADAIDAGWITLWLEVRRLEIGLAQAGFADLLEITFGVDVVLNNLAVRATKSQAAIVQLKIAGAVDQSGVHGGSGAKELDLFLVVVQSRLEERSGIAVAAGKAASTWSRP